MNHLLIEIGTREFPISYFGLAKRNIQEELIKGFFLSEFHFHSVVVDSRKQRFICRIEDIEHNDYEEEQLKLEISQVVQSALKKVSLPIFNEKKENAGSFILYIEWIQLLLNGVLFNITDDFFQALEKPENIILTKTTLQNDYLNTEDHAEKLKIKVRRLAKEKAFDTKINSFIIEKYINKYEDVVPFIAHFNRQFLSLNEKIIETVLNEDFDFLTVYNDGIINEYFIGFLDSDNPLKVKHLVNIVNTRFSEIEKKYSNILDHNIEYYVKKLSELPFMINFGNYFDRTLRIVDIAEQLAVLLDVGEPTIQNVKQIAYLSKADQQTDLVKEFPSLYGTIGMILAEESGYNSIVSSGIFECKKPRFEYDDIPESTAARIVSMTNRLEYIISYYLTHQMDYRALFHLRRKVLGIINILITSKWILDIRELLKSTIYTFLKNDITIDYNKVSKDVIKYIWVVLRDELIRYKYSFYIIDSIMTKEIYDVYDIYKRVQSVSEIVESTDFKILFLARKIHSYCLKHADDLDRLDICKNEKYLNFKKLYLQSQYRTLLKELWLLNDLLEEYMASPFQWDHFELINICNKAFHSIFDVEEVYLGKE